MELIASGEILLHKVYISKHASDMLAKPITWEKLKRCFDLYLVGRCENQSGSLKDNGINGFGDIFHSYRV